MYIVDNGTKIRKMFEILWSYKKMFYLAPAFRKKVTRIDSLAQQVEHNTFNVGVLGRAPGGSLKTKEKSSKSLIIKHYQGFLFSGR